MDNKRKKESSILGRECSFTRFNDSYHVIKTELEKKKPKLMTYWLYTGNRYRWPLLTINKCLNSQPLDVKSTTNILL